ncbi:hypothetical protein HYZ70_01030 [Candidatus Curtissbacteria bacterium]|nr:hypothetical protein [Candidatus Curtissbacteria bacterium]
MISIKKLATIGAAAGLLAASAMPVFADGPFILQKNKGKVINIVTTTANSGGNLNVAENGSDGLAINKDNSIDTGNAIATSTVKTALNTNIVKADCGCLDDGTVIQLNKWGKVVNVVDTTANSGLNANVAENGSDGLAINKNNSINTGNATATSTVKSIVNTNVVKLTD